MYTLADQYSSSSDMSAGVLMLFIGIYAALAAFGIFVYAKIVARTGYPWPWVFIVFVPIVNFVMLLLLAFKTWPVERELELTRRALEAATGSPFPPGSQLTRYGKYPIGSGLTGQGYGSAQGVGWDQGYGPAQGYGSPQGYAAPSYGPPSGAQPFPSADPGYPAHPYGDAAQQPNPYGDAAQQPNPYSAPTQQWTDTPDAPRY